MIVAIDNFILAGCTRFSHWLQRTFGLTNYFVAKIGIALAAIALISDILNYFRPVFPISTPLWKVILDLIILFPYVFIAIECDLAEKDLMRGSRALRQIVLAGPRGRVFVVCMLCYEICVHYVITWPAGMRYYVVGPLFCLGVSILHYFAIVTPLPPGKSRVRAFFESCVRVLRPDVAHGRS